MTKKKTCFALMKVPISLINCSTKLILGIKVISVDDALVHKFEIYNWLDFELFTSLFE